MTTMKTLSIHLSTHYSVYIDHHLSSTTLLKILCEKLNKRPIIITDSHLVHSLGKNCQQVLQKQGLEVELIFFPAGEIHKTRETKQLLEDELLLKQYGRDTCLIALGGGVVTDVVGFVAATYCRGVPVIYLPTTLLAMVDACIGGKTGVNTLHGKNLIGTFSQPYAVLIDVAHLTTLPEHELNNGVVEMIKYGVIANRILLDDLKNYPNKIKQRDLNFLIEKIYSSCLIKKNIVEQDEKEQGLRQLLNFGHTIGHAIEAIENYQISHGEAVAIGMLVESYLSVQCGYLHHSDLAVLQKIFQNYGLPLKTSAFQNKIKFQQQLRLDKKAIRNIPHFVLLDRMGNPHRHQGANTMAVDPVHLAQTLNWAAEYFS